MRIFRRLGLAVVVVAAFAAWPASGAMASLSGQVPLSGTGSAQTGDFTPSGAGDVTQQEFATGDDEAGPDPFDGTISFSTGGSGGGPSARATEGEVEPDVRFRLRGA
jgi:hypothetical protein